MLLETVIFSKEGSQPIVLFCIMGPLAGKLTPWNMDVCLNQFPSRLYDEENLRYQLKYVKLLL